MKQCEKIINVSALVHNFNLIKNIGRSRLVLAMLKANAYGHGLISIGHALKNHADAFGVATMEEAFVLRREHIETPIYLMQGVHDTESVLQAAQNQITVVVIHLEQLKMCCAQSLPLKIWLKINTGMNRSGIHQADFNIAVQWLKASAHLTCLGIMTHFADSDNLQSPQTESQGLLFEEAFQFFIQHLGHHLQSSLSNSAAIFAHPKWHGDVLRPGVALYGASPFADRSGTELGLQPVMTLRSYLIAIYSVKKGERIGYGATYLAEKNMMIGIARAGYGDGYPRACGTGTPVLVRGQMCALAGRVSMDILTINLEACPHAQIGDEVILWGEALSVETIAKAANSIPHELLTGVLTRPKELIQS